MGVPLRWDSYAMEVDWGRNCYACRGFGHMAHYCRNWGQRGKSGRREKTGIWRRRYRGKFAIFEQFKRGRESRVP